MSPTTSSSSSKYHRPGYLRALEAYEGVKAVYKYGRGFIVVRSVAPLVERVAEVRRRCLSDGDVRRGCAS